MPDSEPFLGPFCFFSSRMLDLAMDYTWVSWMWALRIGLSGFKATTLFQTPSSLYPEQTETIHRTQFLPFFSSNIFHVKLTSYLRSKPHTHRYNDGILYFFFNSRRLLTMTFGRRNTSGGVLFSHLSFSDSGIFFCSCLFFF